MTKGWHRESKRHSLARRGIKTAQRININSYTYQDKHQEAIIHSGWKKGNSYRFVLEGTGDIFRELTNPNPHDVYIEEKLRRIENYFQDMVDQRKYFPKTGVHPEDSIQYAKKHNPEKFAKMIKQWEKQPYTTKKQKVAIDLNLAMLRGDFPVAKKLVKEIKKFKY